MRFQGYRFVQSVALRFCRQPTGPEANLGSSVLLMKAVRSLTSRSPSSASVEQARALQHPRPFVCCSGRTGSLLFMARPAKPKPIQAFVLVACILLRRAELGQVAFSSAAGPSSEVETARQIQDAGKRRDWEVVQRLYAAYTGGSMKVYLAAMKAACHCSHYEEAAELYIRLRNLGYPEAGRIVVSHGLKIFRNLHDNDMVDKIWMEILERGWITEGRAHTQLRADVGDIVGAASVLDLMVDRTVQAAHRHYHQAIIACKNSNHSRRYEAAT